jgi:hypothetical protein
MARSEANSESSLLEPVAGGGDFLHRRTDGPVYSIFEVL